MTAAPWAPRSLPTVILSDVVTEQQTVPWVRDVTRDAVRHFAWGIGDNNPLWLQPEYARESPYQDLLAPPSFLYALHETKVALVG